MKCAFKLIPVFICFSLLAQSQIDLVGSKFTLLVDTASLLNSEQAFNLRSTYKLIDQEVPNLAATPSTYWFYLDQSELEPIEGRSVLELAYPTLDDVVVYMFNSNGILDSLLFGEQVQYETRKYKHHNYIFDFNQGINYLIRIRSDDQIMFPVYHGSYQTIMEKNGSKDVINGLYFGIMLVMFLYNLFVYFSTRDKAYLLYVAYLLSVGFMQAIFQGYAFRFVWPGNPWIAQTSVYVFSCLVPITAMWFTQIFIRTKENSKILHYGFVMFMLLYGVAAVIGLVGFHLQSQLFIQAISASAIYTLIAGIIIARKGRREAKFFVIAWAIFLGSVVVWFMKDFGVLPYNDFTNHALQIGSAIEVILLSFALADRINLLKKEKESEQIARIQAIQENERIVTEQNIILESKVEARTKELETSNVELQTTLTDLQSAQSQLVDAEKMASLGQMTAGIAHELNNPINFVSSNVLPLKRDFEDVLEVLNKYEALDPSQPNLRDSFDEIEELKEDVELDYLKEEIHKLLDGIQDGANRTAEIVKGLRVFSRLDEDALKSANLNECISSTLVILKSSVASGVKITKALSPDLPEINCFPGKLNQVFMNVITNAVQATADPLNKKDNKSVIITSSFDEKNVIISIKDNGIGIPDSVKAKIFDPFFTTKEVGDGTGLGLSIVLGIVNDHNGKMTVESTEGEGTEFLLTLPRSL